MQKQQNKCIDEKRREKQRKRSEKYKGGIGMEKVTLFSHILPEEQERMRVCFQMREAVYQNNEIIIGVYQYDEKKSV